MGVGGADLAIGGAERCMALLRGGGPAAEPPKTDDIILLRGAATGMGIDADSQLIIKSSRT